ncbi:MAG: hypothetical protein GC136_04920 [Alphaproteobacteria bacterium]|nr:hypothetical protein [Alphaproteobacteria bacterium]
MVKETAGMLENFSAEISSNYFAYAKSELEGVAQTADNATCVIVDACEIIIESLTQKNSIETSVVKSELERILDACCFQTLTNSRIRKILKSLYELENKFSMFTHTVRTKAGIPPAGVVLEAHN